MSIENNLKGINESLKQLVELQAEALTIMRVQHQCVQHQAPADPTPKVELPGDVEPVGGEPVGGEPVEVVNQADTTVAVAPLTTADLEAAQNELNALLTAGVPMDSIRGVIFNHKLTQLADVGNDRALLEAVLNDARALNQGVAA